MTYRTVVAGSPAALIDAAPGFQTVIFDMIYVSRLDWVNSRNQIDAELGAVNLRAELHDGESLQGMAKLRLFYGNYDWKEAMQIFDERAYRVFPPPQGA
mmetsp:Transcript_65456/g.175554  ORF Transcript_65456/g.175554 Transcript_65456/m.175554 type:complete len:99 (+) Transcript_65456:201-497(+)|eukprot:CAMPEP_0113663056 /NCGR_PEP_ID=MMETSP0038_2-20120614/923_1 /TAXON_ID=2898 /ORGANISM="Cryptomonas paramecium" /LENGTH=98 /DNA_ID=CAMNT_0000578027 /DNA_START=104 /DNA_END=400 /DNA_ORIENTATION=+ /assembly_acc=CAM_ASM_000170